MKRGMVSALGTMIVLLFTLAEETIAQVVVRDSVRITRIPPSGSRPKLEKQPTGTTLILEDGVVSGFVMPRSGLLQVYYNFAERLDWYLPPWASLITIFNGDFSSEATVTDPILPRFPEVNSVVLTYFNGCFSDFEQHEWIYFTNFSAPEEVYLFNLGSIEAGDTVQFVYDTESVFTGQRQILGIWSADEVRLADGTLVGWNVTFGEYNYCLDTWNDRLEVFIGLLSRIVAINEVSFTGAGIHELKSDDGITTYSAPHWLDGNSDGDTDDSGERSYPIAFTRDSTMSLSAKIFVDPVPSGATIKVKGNGPGNIDVLPTPATLDGNMVTLPETPVSSPFLEQIDFFDPMEIQWEVSFDDGSTWEVAGTSRNQVYVTLADPLTLTDPAADPSSQPFWFHTLFHLGCKNAAGETTPEGALEKIWAEFSDREVRRQDGTLLTYYAAWDCGNVTTASLLRIGDGQCIAWAKFLIDLLKVQGIDNNLDHVIILPKYQLDPERKGFLVKIWNFPLFGGGPSPYYDFPYYNKAVDPLIVDNAYVWKSEDVEDETGIPGQGESIVENPASLFNNHQLVFIDGQYYDPSYGGTPKSTLQELEDSAIAGFFRLFYDRYNEPDLDVDLNGDGDKTDLNVLVEEYYIQENPDGFQLKEFRFDY